MRAWMTVWRTGAAAGLLAAALGASACGGTNNLVPPTGATPVPVTETYTDTIRTNGAFTYPFVSQASGTITVTLTAASPATTLGLSLGTWNGVTCQAVISNDATAVGDTVIGTATAIGNFCARVYDTGGVTGPTEFTLTIFRP